MLHVIAPSKSKRDKTDSIDATILTNAGAEMFRDLRALSNKTPRLYGESRQGSATSQIKVSAGAARELFQRVVGRSFDRKIRRGSRLGASV
jgi:hypothetical protein